MSLDVNGFTNEFEGGEVNIKVDANHQFSSFASLWMDSRLRGNDNNLSQLNGNGTSVS